MSAVVHVANIKLRKTIFKMPTIGNPMAGMFAKKDKEGLEVTGKREESEEIGAGDH